VLEGGRAPSRLAQQAVYRRRRVAAALLLVALVAAVTLLAGPALARLAGGDPSPAAGVSAPATTSVVVQPGDTLWSIAAAVAPDRDVRVTVDRLVALNGGAALVPGQVLQIPAG
jgi:nucleoid-associated protein YgaU